MEEKNMKKLFRFAAIASLVVARCRAATIEGYNAGEDKVVEEKEASELVVGASISTLNNPFFISLDKGISDLATEKGATGQSVDAQNNTAKQSNDIDD